MKFWIYVVFIAVFVAIATIAVSILTNLNYTVIGIEPSLVVSITSCITSFLAFVVAFFTMIQSSLSRIPSIKLVKLKKFRDLTIPPILYLKDIDNYYIVVCLSIENNSPNKTKLRDICLHNDVLLNFIFKNKNIQKYYTVSIPQNLINLNEFDFLNDFIAVKNDIIIDSLDCKELYFTFCVKKITKYRRFKIQMRVTGYGLQSKRIKVKLSNLKEITQVQQL